MVKRFNDLNRRNQGARTRQQRADALFGLPIPVIRKLLPSRDWMLKRVSHLFLFHQYGATVSVFLTTVFMLHTNRVAIGFRVSLVVGRYCRLRYPARC